MYRTTQKSNNKPIKFKTGRRKGQPKLENTVRIRTLRCYTPRNTNYSQQDTKATSQMTSGTISHETRRTTANMEKYSYKPPERDEIRSQL